MSTVSATNELASSKRTMAFRTAARAASLRTTAVWAEQERRELRRMKLLGNSRVAAHQWLGKAKAEKGLLFLCRDVQLDARFLNKGTILLRAHEMPTSVYRVVAGEVRVTAHGPVEWGPKAAIELDALGPGSWIGAWACGGEPRPLPLTFTAASQAGLQLQVISLGDFVKSTAVFLGDSFWEEQAALLAGWRRAAEAAERDGPPRREAVSPPREHYEIPRACAMRCCPDLGALRKAVPPVGLTRRPEPKVKVAPRRERVRAGLFEVESMPSAATDVTPFVSPGATPSPSRERTKSNCTPVLECIVFSNIHDNK